MAGLRKKHHDLTYQYCLSHRLITSTTLKLRKQILLLSPLFKAVVLLPNYCSCPSCRPAISLALEDGQPGILLSPCRVIVWTRGFLSWLRTGMLVPDVLVSEAAHPSGSFASTAPVATMAKCFGVQAKLVSELTWSQKPQGNPHTVLSFVCLYFLLYQGYGGKNQTENELSQNIYSLNYIFCPSNPI